MNVRPEVVWDILTDYRNGQPLLFPEAYRHIVIDEGGKGAGTTLLYFPPVPAKVVPERIQVTLPEPGRVLMESTGSGGSRTFTLTSVEDGAQTHIEVVSDVAVDIGLVGHAGLLFASPLMPYIRRKAFRRLLDRLEYAAQTWPMPTPQGM